ncbi:unnamed protein product [Symbiodinium sp. CCMP2592]|nr:unnamed protein product [Symbiodinium sp. CCMP2592]
MRVARLTEKCSSHQAMHKHAPAPLVDCVVSIRASRAVANKFPPMQQVCNSTMATYHQVGNRGVKLANMPRWSPILVQQLICFSRNLFEFVAPVISASFEGSPQPSTAL